MKPVLFITGHVPPVRREGLALLHEREVIELALFGGRHMHGAAAAAPPPGVPSRAVSQLEAARLAGSGAYRAVVAGTGGRLALPASWRAVRRARVPFVFWAALWHQPLTPAHLAAQPLMRQIYRHADAIVTYGEHVSRHVRARGARNVHIAPQAVDNAFWSTGGPARDPDGPLRVLFVGRPERAKGLQVLLEAWRIAGLWREGARLTIAGGGATEGAPGAEAVGTLTSTELRNSYGVSHVVVMPSVRTRSFVEPWGLVANEAMNQGTTIVASDAVGAAAGGLVRDGRNGLVVPAGDAAALAGALRALDADRARCRELGEQGRRDVAALTPGAWAAGFSAALESIGQGREALLASA